MSLWQVICGIVLLISGVFLIIVVLLQEPKQQGAGGVITGGVSDTYYDKNKARTKEIKLQKLTKYMAIVFFVLTLLVNLVPILLPADSGNVDAPFDDNASIVEQSDVSAEASTAEESTASTDDGSGAESAESAAGTSE
jgi:protein translocase, SecG subunit